MSTRLSCFYVPGRAYAQLFADRQGSRALLGNEGRRNGDIAASAVQAAASEAGETGKSPRKPCETQIDIVT
jgi:hypothetical protein